MTRCLFVLLCAALLAPGAAFAQDDEGRGGLDEDKLVELLEQAIEGGKKKNKQDMGVVAKNRREAINAALIKRTIDSRDMTVHFNATPLVECLDFLRDVTGLNIVLSKEVRKEFGEVEIKLRLKRVKIRSVLNLLLEQTDKELRYGVRHGVLWIGHKDEWKAKKVLRVIDVSDILHRPPDFPAPKLGLGPDGGITFDD